MFKRANKITSLLVAAAAIVSIVPASAAEVKKVDSQDGVVYNAVAYKNGTALFDGEVKDNDGAYYLKDGKYTSIADVDSGSDYAVFGSKYVNVDEGDYFVDLETGKSTDDSIDEDAEDDAASALRKKIKESDRYADNNLSTTEFGDDEIADLTRLSGNKFADLWYSTAYAADTTKKGASTATSYTIYTDEKGNYIDADYNLGKIKIQTTDGSATIENSVDTEDIKVNGTTTKASAQVVFSKVLGQDKDNIYRYAELKITVPGAVGTVEINNKAINVSDLAKLPVIQKISKAQDSDDIDDGKYAKTVSNYIISDDSAKLDTTAKDFIRDTATKAAVIGGKLVVSSVENTKDKDDNVVVYAMTLKTTNGFYYTDLEDKTTATTEFNSDLGTSAFDTDVDGNIYVLEDGYVKKFDGTDDWTKLYKVDGSMDSISAYDKDNMVVWSQEDEVFSLIGGKKTAETTTETTTAPAVKAGWAKATDGTWTFVKADGTKATGWYQDGATWYYLGATGTMATGWQNVGGTWYYLAGSGAMVTGWFTDATGTWYYTNASGAMLSNTVVDGYKLGASGAWVK